MVGFLFGGNTGETAESIARKRKMIEGMLSGDRAPRTAQEGWGQVLASLGGAIGNYRLDQQEKSGADESRKLFGEVAKDLFGGSGTSQPASSAGISSTASPINGTDVGNSDYFTAIRAAESGGNDNAKNPSSSATGRYQFIDSTWNGLSKKYPELGLTPDGRTDPEQQERAIRAFTKDNADALSGAGIAATPGNLYAAHFLGAGGARSVLSGNDADPVSSHVGANVVAANPFLRGMTVGDFRNWTSKKAGGGTEPVNLGGPVEVASADPNAAMAYAPPAQSPAAAAIETQAPGSGYVDPMVRSQPRAAPPLMPEAPPREVSAASVPPNSTPVGNPNSPFVSTLR